MVTWPIVDLSHDQNVESSGSIGVIRCSAQSGCLNDVTWLKVLCKTRFGVSMTNHIFSLFSLFFPNFSYISRLKSDFWFSPIFFDFPQYSPTPRTWLLFGEFRKITFYVCSNHTTFRPHLFDHTFSTTILAVWKYAMLFFSWIFHFRFHFRFHLA